MTKPETPRTPILREQLRLVHGHTALGQSVTAFLAILIAVVLWVPEDARDLLTWLAMVGATISFRIWLSARFLGRDAAGFVERYETELVQLRLAVILSGTVWGTIVYWHYPAGDAPREIFMCVATMGMASGALSMLANAPGVYPSYAIAMSLPFVLAFVGQGSAGRALLAPTALLYAYTLTVVARKYHQQVAEGLVLRFDNEALIAELTTSREQALDAKRDAESADQAKGRFLADMSHEVRTPLNGILALTQLAQDADPTAQGDFLKRIGEAGSHLHRIVDDILDFSRIEAGKLTLEVGAFQLQDIMNGVASAVAPVAALKGLSFSIDIAPGVPPRLSGDPTRLRQILINLAGNAVKFTDQGAVTIAARRLDEQDGRVRLRFTVRDTGIGLTRDQLGELFQPFSQAATSTARRDGGTGLGLVISRRLAGLMGGDIEVTSLPGSGSVFEVTLSFASAPPVAGAPALRLAGAPRTLAGLRVLVAEDDRINRQLIEQFLHKAGASTVLVENGAEAVSAARAQVFDAVLMDVRMPVLDGLAATRELRADPRTARLPILGVTGRVFDDDVRACLAAGMNDHVAKPLRLEELSEKLHAWTRAHGAPPAAPPAAAPLPERAAGVVVDLARALARLDGDRELLNETLRMFRLQELHTPQQIRAAIAAGDVELAHRLAHTLGSLAAAIEADALSGVCRRIEADLWMKHRIDDAALAELDARHAEVFAELARTAVPDGSADCGMMRA